MKNIVYGLKYAGINYSSVHTIVTEVSMRMSSYICTRYKQAPHRNKLAGA